jgi:hypothetical protein
MNDIIRFCRHNKEEKVGDRPAETTAFLQMSDSVDVDLADDIKDGVASLLLDDELHLAVAHVDDGGAWR